MQYESSDQIETREAMGPELPRPSALPFNGPSLPTAPVPPVDFPAQARPLPSAIPARPGCVMAASSVLFFLAASASCRFSEALSNGNLFGAFASFASSVLIFMIALGLFRMYRWAANLVLIYCVAWSVEFVGTQLISVSIINPYMTHPVSKILLFGVMLVMSLVVLMLPAVAFWWFWRRRRDFGRNPMVENWGRPLYILATVIMIAGAVSTLLDTNNTMPEQLEPQMKQLRQMDADMYNVW
ncbi:MAG: hypothetical protein HY862_08565 [Chloroflexi bacterium]|nr:hypothetical protein [Chloroflexota bacterium]